MTKEEQLKQEAEEYAEGMAKYYASTHEDCIPSQFEKYLRNAYISSSEPREKQIQIDAEQIRALQKQNGELTDKVKELQEEITQLKVRDCNSEAGNNGLNLRVTRLQEQIEKMKCCGNCANLCGCGLRGYEECKNFDKWEIKEK